MKLLIFKAYYDPEKAASLYLTTNLLEDLSKAGYDIELHVPTPTRGISDEVRREYKHRRFEELYWGKLKVYRFAMFRENNNPIQRVFRYLLCNLIYLIKGLIAKDIDLVFVGSTPPTMGIVASLIKRFKKVPMIYNLQDVFPDSLVSTGFTKQGSFLWNIGRILENYTYDNADKIIVISEDFKQNIANKGVPKEKIEVIYNWVDENAIIPIDRNDNVLFDRFNLKRDLFYVVYAGNLGSAQNIEVILKVAHELLDCKLIQFVIFGGGSLELYYKDMAHKLNLTNVTFFPLQPYSLVSEVYSLGDASIVSCKKGIGKSAMPSKTWSIMSAGTAVIANFDVNTDLQRIIEENNVGVFSIADDVIGFKNAILKLYNDRDLCELMGRNGREYILNNLRRQIGTEKFINVIKTISKFKR